MKARGLSSDAELAARLAAIVQSSEDAIIGKTVDDVITAWNPSAERIFGFTAAEALGQPISIIIPDDRLAEEEELRGRIARGEIVDRLQTVRRGKDGRRIAVVLSVAPIRTPDGRVLGASAILRDVSERQRALDALQRSESQASVILEAASEGIVIVNAAGAIIAVNRQMEAMFGYPRTELAGRPLEILLPERFRSRHAVHRAGYMRDPRVRSMGRGLDLTARRRDGSEFPVEISLSYLQTDDGLRAMAFVTDITERKAMERATRQAERLSALGRLSAGIAHEVNNPIGIMTARIELILMDAEANKLPAETIEDLRVVHRNAIRVATIAKNLLSFARETPRDRALVDMNEVVRNVLLLVTTDFTRQRARLHPELEEPLPRILAHPNALEQVVLNLVTNAVEALSEGGDIRITTAADGDRVRLAVADTGRGIAAEDLAHIFDPFFTTKASGTGLGLSVSYGIVEDHRGTIDVESTPGKGTTFVVSLPVADTRGTA
ncbi:MAG TPA: PAS domain S-box protein [Methylomirabilota bacterium]|nr:PAS domain S-box protein [Methylomirabilota bacterium]